MCLTDITDLLIILVNYSDIYQYDVYQYDITGDITGMTYLLIY